MQLVIRLKLCIDKMQVYNIDYEFVTMDGVMIDQIDRSSSKQFYFDFLEMRNNNEKNERIEHDLGVFVVFFMFPSYFIIK
jgi:hypothetical protein